MVFRILPHKFRAKASAEGPRGKRALPIEPLGLARLGVCTCLKSGDQLDAALRVQFLRAAEEDSEFRAGAKDESYSAFSTSTGFTMVIRRAGM